MRDWSINFQLSDNKESARQLISKVRPLRKGKMGSKSKHLTFARLRPKIASDLRIFHFTVRSRWLREESSWRRSAGALRWHQL